jgi:hypothetical protein
VVVNLVDLCSCLDESGVLHVHVDVSHGLKALDHMNPRYLDRSSWKHRWRVEMKE